MTMHPVVELFLRRAASNPEEMSNGRWKWVIERIQMHGSQIERDAVLPVYNKLRLDGVHKEMMEALLNPEPEQRDLFPNIQDQFLTQALTPYKKLGQP